jgi:hypothetical protein
VGGLAGGSVGVGWAWWHRSELASLVVGEGEPIGAAGVAVDAEEPEVHHPMVHGAEGQEVA